MRKNMYHEPDFEKNCINAQISQTFVRVLKESCEPTITSMKDIFGHLKLKENYIIPCDVVEDEKVDEFFNDLNLDENISPNETAKELSEHPLLERYLQHACRERNFFFCEEVWEKRLHIVFCTFRCL